MISEKENWGQGLVNNELCEEEFERLKYLKIVLQKDGSFLRKMEHQMKRREVSGILWDKEFLLD